MTFTIPTPNLIVSSTGYSVEVLGLTGIRYTEGDAVYFVDSELLAPPAAIAVFASSVRRWEDPPGASVEEQERQRVIGNVLRAFEFKGYETHVG
jgi:hypothetical protein